jgi:3-oxoacyl-[acyl-carrier-protein] synthase-3
MYDRRMQLHSRIAGTGSYLPDRILSNFDLEKMVETSDAWIRERTGIEKRHIAAPGQTTTDLAANAAKQALMMAGLKAEDIDGIIFATVTPDQIMPSAACLLQMKLGCAANFAFDISAACSGFVFALQLADSLIRTGSLKNVLVIGAETLSRIIDFKDRETCILFGDGAGAVVLSATDKSESQFYGFHTRSNGSLGDLLSLKSGRPDNPLALESKMAELPFVHMKGREIFKNAVRAMAESAESVLKMSQLTHEDVNWFIPHQANVRIIQSVGTHLGIDPEKVIVNIAETGNTSSATIPIAFDQAVRDQRIKRGQTVLFAAFGAGLTYGATAFRF